MYITIKQAASVLNVSTKTIQRRINDGSLIARKLGTKSVRIDENDLKNYFERQKKVVDCNAGSHVSTSS
jgi:excisionase family DNA binding protein